jgi:beta-aspartyl-peptidase (threonine type)
MGIRPILVVHAGAGRELGEERAAFLEGVRAALGRGLAALPLGASAAVREAVVSMEACEVLNAGRGAVLDVDGHVRLDAGFMEGMARRYGAVTGVTRTPHPVLLAEHLTTVGDYGAFLAPPAVDELAAAIGAPLCEPADLVSERASRRHAEALRLRAQSAEGSLEQDDGSEDAGGTDPPRSTISDDACDTVGAVALDANGHLAAAVSTGGVALKQRGRVGDSPVVGAGFWACNDAGACVTTGVGEVLLRQGTARRCIALLAAGATPADAAAAALAETVDFDGDRRGPCGLILVSPEGAVCIRHTSAVMPAGWVRADDVMEINDCWR